MSILTKLSKKRVLIPVVVGVVIIAAGVIIWLQMSGLVAQLASTNDTSTQKVKSLGETTLTTKVTAARAKATAGDTTGALASLDATIEQTESTSEKAELYIEKGQISADSGDADAAIVSYKQAAESEPSVKSYDVLGQQYEDVGNNTDAIEAYQAALKEFDARPPAEEGQITRGYYVYKIVSLGGTAS